MRHDFFGIISHFIFNQTHLITGSSKIISSENLEKFGAKWSINFLGFYRKKDFLEIPLYTLKFNSLVPRVQK